MSSPGESFSLARTAIVGVLIAITAFLLLAWCVINGYTIDEQAKAIGITKDILTIVALALGGFWTLRIYLKQRSDAFALNVKQSVVIFQFSSGWLLKVNATIQNVGKTRVQLSLWRYRADLLLPLTSEGEKAIAAVGAFSESGAPWPSIAEATLTDKDFGFSIEPGATQTESANIILPKWVEAVQIYSFFSGPPDLARGWWDRIFVDLRKELSDGRSSP